VSVEPRRIKKIIRKLPDAEENSLAQAARVRQEHIVTHTKPRVVEGFVTLTQLAAERGIQAQLARIWMHRAKIQRPADGWRWKDGSRELKKVRKALELLA
jgi:hypothetical protein